MLESCAEGRQSECCGCFSVWRETDSACLKCHRSTNMNMFQRGKNWFALLLQFWLQKKKHRARKRRRRAHLLQLRRRFAGGCPSILSSNCIGGMMCHDLRIPFASPTVNLLFEPADFLTFVENFRYYLSLDLVEDKNNQRYGKGVPVGKLGDLTLYFIHYQSFDEAKRLWMRRKARVDEKHLFVVAQDFSEQAVELYDEELMRRFQALPYPKVLYSLKPRHLTDCVYSENLMRNYQPGDMFSIRPDGRRGFDDFDWVSWLNQGRKPTWYTYGMLVLCRLKKYIPWMHG